MGVDNTPNATTKLITGRKSGELFPFGKTSVAFAVKVRSPNPSNDFCHYSSHALSVECKGCKRAFHILQDLGGNLATCTFSITVIDTISPTITCPEDIAVIATDTAGVLVNYKRYFRNNTTKITFLVYLFSQFTFGFFM